MKLEFKVIQPKPGELEKQALREIRKQLETKLKQVECPDHHQHPQLVVSGSALNPSFKVEGCCQKLIDLAAEALK